MMINQSLQIIRKANMKMKNQNMNTKKASMKIMNQKKPDMKISIKNLVDDIIKIEII